MRTSVVDYFKANEARFDVNFQRALDDEKKCPIEDAKVVWPEEESPYRKVAQQAYDRDRQQTVDSNWSFFPAHALAAHGTLGTIMPGRMAVYPALSKLRLAENARAMIEPTRADAVSPS